MSCTNPIRFIETNDVDNEACQNSASRGPAQKVGIVFLRQDGSEKNAAPKKACEAQREAPALPVKAIRVEDLTSENYLSGDAREAYDLVYGQGYIPGSTTH